MTPGKGIAIAGIAGAIGAVLIFHPGILWWLFGIAFLLFL